MARGTRIGVDIGATAVRAAELSMRGTPPSLVRAAQVPLEPGAVAGGEIRNPEAVAAALRELWHRGHFRSREVVLGVSNQRVVVAIVRSVGSLDGMGLEAGDTGDEAVVDIGADVTSICVHAWGVPRFVRILPSGGRDITSAVARSMGVSDEEAESMKRAVAGGGRSGDQVSTVTASRSSSFADEIRSSLEFYLTQMPGAKMGRVLVTGGGSKLPGLMQLLAERLPSPVAAGHAFGRVRNSLDMPADAMTEAEPLLAVAVGLGIPGGGG